MDDAEVVDRLEGYWVVRSRDRRYFLQDEQFSCREGPYIGQKGWLGYVQRPSSVVLRFTDRKVTP
ncbi:MAG: hypothetical protein ACM31D_07805 [Bacteroidota bacterium]